MRGIDQMSQPGHAERARTPHGIVPAGLRGRVYWGTPHSTPQFWGTPHSTPQFCYARVHSRPMRDLGQIAQSDHCGPTRHVQRPRDGLALAPSVSTSSTVLCLQRGKVRLGCVSLLSFATSARTPLICPIRTPRTHSTCATAP